MGSSRNAPLVRWNSGLPRARISRGSWPIRILEIGEESDRESIVAAPDKS